MKNWIKCIIGLIRKFSLSDFLFGKVKTYRVTAEGMTYDLGARSYSLKENGFAVLYDGFSKVGSFLNVRSVMEV